MYQLRGRLDPEVGALLMRADAIGLLAERALQAGLEGAGAI